MNILQLNGYRVTVSFNDRRLMNTPMIPPEITSIVMSDYFTGHPQYFMIYNIYVQALYGEGLNVANRSNLAIASKSELYISVGQYQYFTSGIRYCKFKVVFYRLVELVFYRLVRIKFGRTAKLYSMPNFLLYTY